MIIPAERLTQAALRRSIRLAPVITTRPSSSPRLKALEWAAPARPEGSDFVFDTVRRLRGLNLRLTVCRIEASHSLPEALNDIDDIALLVGPHVASRRFVVYLSPASLTDDEAGEQLLERLRTALGEAALQAVTVAMVHRPAKALCDGTSLMEELAALSSTRLIRQSDAA